MTSEWRLDLRHFRRLVVLLSRSLAVVSHKSTLPLRCLSITVRFCGAAGAGSDAAQHAHA